MSTNPKDAIGLTKPALRLVPPALALHVSQAMADGAKKYGAYNWREHPVRLTVYIEAAMRHLYALLDGEDRARDSGHLHAAHVAACMAIILDAFETQNLIDDRADGGCAADVIETLTLKPEDKVEGTYEMTFTIDGKAIEGLESFVYEQKHPFLTFKFNGEPDEPIPYTPTEPGCFVCEHDFCQCPQTAAERPVREPDPFPVTVDLDEAAQAFVPAWESDPFKSGAV